MYLAILKVNNKNIFGYLQILDVYKKAVMWLILTVGISPDMGSL